MQKKGAILRSRTQTNLRLSQEGDSFVQSLPALLDYDSLGSRLIEKLLAEHMNRQSQCSRGKTGWADMSHDLKAESREAIAVVLAIQK